MSNGVPYDSPEGRATAAAITALMTGRAYRESARIAATIGPYDGYAENREPHNAVMRMHRDASRELPQDGSADAELVDAARRTWDETVEAGEEHGYRNAQATVLAPTGTISFLMDCDTTGVEPDFSLVKFKELVGGGQMTIVNRTVPLALRTLGYASEQIEAIGAHIEATGTIVSAPALRAEHLPVFDVAVGERAISHLGHIKMMGAVQPFISGAISKTVNLPQTATVEDIADAYTEAWRLGVKALAIYRDGSKTAQALRTDAQEEVKKAAGVDVEAAIAEALAKAPPKRRRMPRERQSITHKFSIGGHEGYITAGMYEDGTVGEIFLTDIGKEGSTLRGMMNSYATAISIALQYGVPLETLVQQVRVHALRARGDHPEPRDPLREVDARLHHALARLALPRRRRVRGARHPHPRGACSQAGPGGRRRRSRHGRTDTRRPGGLRRTRGVRTARDAGGPRRSSRPRRLHRLPPVSRPASGLDLGPACRSAAG